jgi:hypothetical protein
VSAPIILSISPAAGDKDVVLGTDIEVTFDQPISPQSVGESTFSLMGPGQTGLINPEQLIKSDPKTITGREYIPGKFSFPAHNKLVFNPGKPLRPHVKYTLLLVGAGALTVRDAIKNAAGEPLAKNVQITFETGELDTSSSPVQSPLPFDDPQVAPWMRPKLQPADIVVHPRRSVGNDLQQVIELVFPAPLNPASFNLDDIEVSVEPLAHDPLVTTPSGLTAAKRIEGNKIIVTISGWPS